MRPSYGDQLIQLDEKRRVSAYGRRAKILHLKVLTFVSAVLYAFLRITVWVFPPTVTHAWIDDVLVEVVEDDRMDRAASVALGVFAVSVLLLVILYARRLRRGGVECPPWRRRLPGSHHSHWPPRVWPTASVSSIAVRPSAAFGSRPRVVPSLAACSAASGVGGERPIRTDAELRDFLALQERRRPSDGASGGLRVSAAPRNVAAFGAPLLSVAAASASDGIRVQYRGSAGGASRPAAHLVDTEWAALGIHNAERSLLKARRWVSEMCQSLAEEIAACDRWLAEHQIRAFDSCHSLQETIPVPNLPPTGFAMPPSPPVLRKLDALLGERQKLAGAAQNVQNFDTILRLDQRLALESKLDPSGTFPPPATLSAAEQQARRQYIIRRIRTFAAQKTLASYKHKGGDPEHWRDGMPCDAHLLAHLVRVCVEGFANYVKFPHQPMNAQQDLALFVGDTGEPYFYVRYRGGSVDKTYGTHQGANSLFEALLIFAAVVKTYHDASYGGIWGVMDLSKTGLMSLF